MKKIFNSLKNADISSKTFWIMAVSFVAIRLLVASLQTMTLYPETSMLDDMLMYKAANNILAGEWLGAYNYLTIGKHMLFSVWLAFINKLGISYLLAGQLLYVGASGVLIGAFSPAIKNKLFKLCFFTFMIFSPASFANFTLRVYRDNITVAFVILVFAGFIGFALRALRNKTGSLFGWGLVGGFALGCSWLLREDGAWLAPFCIVAAAVIAFFIARNKPKKILTRLSALACTFFIAISCVLVYCGLNYAYYGRFVVSDFTSSEFCDAYGAITRVVIDENDYNPIVPVPLSSRDKLYNVSPLFASLKQYLESEDFLRWQKDCGNDELEYSGGGFYWAVRNAASLAGYYETPQKAKQFYIDLANEINTACDNGKIEAIGKRSGLNSPISSNRILPVLQESLRSLSTVVTYNNIDNSPEISIGSELVMDELEQFLNCEAKRTTKTQNGSKRVVVWAISNESYVDISISELNNLKLNSNIRVSTASDVYLDQIFELGRDLRYTGASRHTIIYKSDSDQQLLTLAAGKNKITIPAEVTSGAISENGITYCVEYAGSDFDESVEFGFAEIWIYRGMRVLVLIYGILSTLMFIVSTALFCGSFLNYIRKKAFIPDVSILFIVALSFLLMAALRIGIVSFAETTAFGIGTYPMYLAAVYPLLIGFQFVSIAIYLLISKRS